MNTLCTDGRCFGSPYEPEFFLGAEPFSAPYCGIRGGLVMPDRQGTAGSDWPSIGGEMGHKSKANAERRDTLW